MQAPASAAARLLPCAQPRQPRGRAAACCAPRPALTRGAPPLARCAAFGGGARRALALPQRVCRPRQARRAACCAAAPAADAATDNAERRTIVSAALALALCNMCRVCMSVAVLPIAQEFGWQPAVQGLVQASFLYGYTASQIQGGVLADRIGGKVVIAAAIAVFAVATLLTPLSLTSAAVSAGVALPLMLGVRALVGLGEGVVLPSVTNMLAQCVPPQRRAKAVGAAFAGFHGGTILGLLLSPPILQRFGWPGLFYVFGALGLPVLLFWQRVVPARAGPAVQAGAAGPSFAALLRSKAVWAIVIANMVNHANYFIFLFMMPTYFANFWQLNVRSSALYSLLPWLAMGGMSYTAGAIADALLPRLGTVKVRKTVQAVAFLGPAVLLCVLLSCTSSAAALACLTLALGLASFGQAGFVSNIQDVGGRAAGRLFGVANTAGCLAGIAGTTAAGFILQRGTWGALFQLQIALYLAGAVVYLAFARAEGGDGMGGRASRHQNGLVSPRGGF